MAEMKEDRPVGRAAESPGDAPHGRGTMTLATMLTTTYGRCAGGVRFPSA